MFDDFLAIVPSRRGSSFKGKNTQFCSGRELVRWTLDACKDLGIRTIVSTDDVSVKAIAGLYNFEVDHRPKMLSNHRATLDEVAHYVSIHYPHKNYVLLPPTSPLRTAENIRDAISLFKDIGVDSVLSVTPESRSIWKDEGGGYGRCVRAISNNRQDTAPYLIANGAIFVYSYKVAHFLKKKVGGKVGLYQMTEGESVDVHSKEDIHLAEHYFKKRTLREKDYEI